MEARMRDYVRSELLKRAEQDIDFRGPLLRDPSSAVKAAFGVDPPDDLELLALEETPGRFYLVLPPAKPGRDATVSLREVTESSVRAVCNLKVASEQEGFVAPNAVSMSEAQFNPKAWF